MKTKQKSFAVMVYHTKFQIEIIADPLQRPVRAAEIMLALA